MSKKLNRTQIHNKAKQLISCKNSTEVEHLLKLNHCTLVHNALIPKYHYFKIPKTKGGFRQIEAPTPSLKKIQRKLNQYLQYTYFNVQSISAYGFVINTKKQYRKNKSKNIVSNAQKHLGNPYLLNIDFNDFFHQISDVEVKTIFKNYPFNFSQNLSNTLTKICTNKGRLPMGAPTSPVLSNFACLSLDADLLSWANKNNITYTRFVDDLSFSSKNKITQQHYLQIKQITDKYEFVIDQFKTRWYTKNQEKIVTGLLVNDKIELQASYLKELDKDLNRLQKTVEVQIITGNINKPTASKKFKQEIMGKINFIALVKGYDSNQYNDYLIKFETATNPPNKEQLTLRWVHFNNYNNF